VSDTEKSRISQSSQLKRGDESISGDSKKMGEHQIVIIAGTWSFRDIPGNSEQRYLLKQDGRNNGKRSRMWSDDFLRGLSEFQRMIFTIPGADQTSSEQIAKWL
jgi:hypothetical protein